MGVAATLPELSEWTLTLLSMEGWKNGRLERTIKEFSQFDNKKPEELESEFGHFDVANSYQLHLSKAVTSWL